MRFVYPFILLFLLIVPFIGIAWFWSIKRSKEKLAALSYHALQTSDRRLPIQIGLILAAISLLIISLARPQWGVRNEEVTVRGRNLILAVDVSRSMLATDVHPNRLGRAKADLIDLIDELEGDRAGLIAFRKDANIVCPLTSDYGFLRQSIDYLSVGSAAKGATDLAAPIDKALSAFEQAESSHNAIVLISDGEDLSGHAIAAAKRAKEKSIPIFTVGIGSEIGSTIQDETGIVKFKDKIVQTKLTESTLSEIAQISGGRYIPLATAATARTTLGSIYRRYLRQLADQEQKELLENQIQERYAVFLIPGILLLVAAGMMSRGRLTRMKRTETLAVFFLIIATQNIAMASPARDAQAAYNAGDYTNSVQFYREAIEGAEADSAAKYAFNAAIAAKAAGDSETAVKLLIPLTENPVYTAKANILCGLIEREKADGKENLDERLTAREASLAAFQRAALAEPENETIQRNLTRALDGMVQLRKDAHVAKVLAAHEKEQLGQLIVNQLTRQRALMKSAPETFSLKRPSLKIAQADELAKSLTEQADLCIAIREKLKQAVTNETDFAEIAKRIDEMKSQLIVTSESIADLKSDATAVNASEPLMYDLWKGVADPQMLLNEAINIQTNYITKTIPYQPTRQDKPEVEQLARQFQLTFPEWADQKIRETQNSTNQPPFTIEDKNEIIKLTNELEPLTRTDEKIEIMDKLLAINEKMPKQNQNNDQQNPQDQQQQQDRKKEEQKQQNQNNEQNQQQQDQQQQQNQEKEEQKDSPENQPKDPTPQQIQNMLQRAMDREREHEEDKDKKAYATPLPPDEQDW